jgi:hypothetical protein
MHRRQILIFCLIAGAALGALYLLASGPLKPLPIGQLAFTPLPCSGEPITTDLSKAADPQVRRLTAYQLLCQSSAIHTLVLPTGAGVPDDFATHKLNAIHIDSLASPQPTEVNGTLWLPAITNKDLSPTARTAVLQDVATQAEQLLKQGKSVGIYLIADGDSTYFTNDANESLLRDFITRCNRSQIPLALYDRG